MSGWMRCGKSYLLILHFSQRHFGWIALLQQNYCGVNICRCKYTVKNVNDCKTACFFKQEPRKGAKLSMVNNYLA